MPRAFLLSVTIVAAFQIHLAAASSVVESSPLTPPVVALAERIGVSPERDPVRFIADVTRFLYATPDTRPPVLLPVPGVPGAPSAVSSRTSGPVITVPVPLPAIWSRNVFHHSIAPEQLVATILSDRRAALLCRGLSGLDDETLAYLGEHPSLIQFIYERASTVFAAFGGNLRIRGGRIVPPGGEQAAPLWEALVQAPLSSPDRFARVLFVEFEGRLAYLYDVIASAEPASAAFALGLSIPDETTRVERFRALFAAIVGSYGEWKAQDYPFVRPLGDLAVLLLRIHLDPDGLPSPPASRAFWGVAFDVGANASGAAADAQPNEGGAGSGTIDAAWLVNATGGAEPYSRTSLVDQFAFGQRVFAASGVADNPQAAEALKEFRRNRMLMLTLDRMGISSPATYAAALRRADSLASAGSGRRFWTVAQFQGALAMLDRMRRAGTLTASEAEELVSSLVAVPLRDGEYAGAMAEWVQTTLESRLPDARTWEGRAILALAGPERNADRPRLSWEGQTYRLDLPSAERRRLEIVRGKQGGHTLDLALALDGFARTLRNGPATAEAIGAVARDLKALADASVMRLKRPAVTIMPPNVEPPRDGLEWAGAIVEELNKIARSGQVRRATRFGNQLQQLSDIVLGDALASIAYAIDLGDPDSAAMLGSNVALRHDFGFGHNDSESRIRSLWALPRQDFHPGVPWHITGSLLGLDIALAPLNLRRLSIDRVAEAPRVSSIERDALAVGVTLMDPSRLSDADRDRIAVAIARGRARVEALSSSSADVAAIAELLGFDGLRRRTLEWVLEHEPASLEERFSLVDLLTLGGGASGADLDAWGTSGIYFDGCLCTRFPLARAWRVLEGRPQLPMMAATMGDLGLAIALELRDMKMPAAMVRPVLSVGMQDFIDELSAANERDWWGLSRQAQSVDRQRIEDYVSAAAAVDGPLVPDEVETSRDY